MDNDQVLLEALAEDQESLKKKVKQLEAVINEETKGALHDEQMDKLVKLFNHLSARLKKLENQNDASVELDKPNETKITRVRINRKMVVAFMLIGSLLWYCAILINRGIKYEEPYYKYQSMDLFGLSKNEVDYHYQLNEDSMIQVVEDSINHIHKRRKAQNEIEEYHQRINSLKEEFKLNSKNE
ncbi:hypothetical protein [Ekhidna sp.]|uniref:hypothetical protein n=1 Tax=Ekhidna sp. TaxID=2608089 RepID=UPI0032EF4649